MCEAAIAASCFEVCRTSELSVRETDWYFLRRAKSTAKTRRGLRPSGLPGTIQSSAGNNLGKAPDGTSRNRFFAQDGGEKALNRCDTPALQREELERTAKEWPCSLQTVGYGWVRMGDGGRKRVALDGNYRKVLCKLMAFGLRKRAVFSAFRKVFYK